MKIGYIGSSKTAINALKYWEGHSACIWFCDSTKKSRELDLFSEKIGIPLIYIDKEEQIINWVENTKQKLDYFVVYKTSIIFHQRLLEKCDLYNFHPGSLATNRGPYPLVWTVLLGEKTATMSLHKIESKIDAGPLIFEVELPVFENETPQCLEKRLEQEIPNMLDKIDLYRDGKHESKIIENGIYRRRITKSDYTIDFEKDSFAIMRQKVNSQRGYNGAILIYNNQELRCVSVEIVDKISTKDVPETKKLFLEKDGCWYCFSLSED